MPNRSSGVEGASRGDHSSFLEVWTRYSPLLYRRCLYWMGGSRHLADEAFSRAALTIYLKLPAHAAELRNPRAWMLRITHNLCMDVHREIRRWQQEEAPPREAEDGALDSAPAESAGSDPESSVLFREMRHILGRGIDALPERLRSTFVLYLSNRSYRETSERQSITQENARKRVQEARAILRSRLAEYVTGVLREVRTGREP